MKAHHYLLPFASFDRDAVPLVDFHMHTTWTDGQHSVAEMHAAAVAAGLKCILYSEHARRTSGPWFQQFAAEVRALPDNACRALVGVEAKVANFDGALDLSDETRASCDLVMASVHRFPGETAIVKGRPPLMPADEVMDIEFRLSRAAIRAGGADILGHPFGMSYRRFGIVPCIELVEALMEECAAHGVAFEVNAHYHPDPWRFVDMCCQRGAAVSLGSNAHHRDEIGKIVRALREPLR